MCIRIIASAVLCAMIIGLAAWLLALRIEVPAVWWGIGGVAVTGVVGADIITTYRAKEQMK
jgi:hypothetical protein